jgi:hypothetical protein
MIVMVLGGMLDTESWMLITALAFTMPLILSHAFSAAVEKSMREDLPCKDRLGNRSAWRL